MIVYVVEFNGMVCCLIGLDDFVDVFCVDKSFVMEDGKEFVVLYNLLLCMVVVGVVYIV